MEIANLLSLRDDATLTQDELAENEAAIRRAILTLWQTNLLRHTKLYVLDEVTNGISYYDYTFFRALPRLYSDLEDQLQASTPQSACVEVGSFLRIGSWIGGDRDGNPFVTAEILQETLRAQSTRVLQYYLDELHELGGELSLSTRIVHVSPALAELASRSPDSSTHRQNEPTGRQLPAYMRVWRPPPPTR